MAIELKCTCGKAFGNCVGGKGCPLSEPATHQQLQEAAKAYADENASDVGHMSWHNTTPNRGLNKAFLAGAALVQAQSAGVWVKACDERPKEGWHCGFYNSLPCGVNVDNGDIIITLPNGRILCNPELSLLRYLSESPTTGGESEAVAFGEWCRNNYVPTSSGYGGSYKKNGQIVRLLTPLRNCMPFTNSLLFNNHKIKTK